MTIEVRNVSKAFGTYHALNNVNLTVADGELMALLGPSGSGKTTLLRIIAGLDQTDDGQVLVHGQDLTKQAVRDRRVGFVFQHYSLFKNMSVFENVAFGLRLAGGIRGADLKVRVESALRDAAIWDEVKDKLNADGRSLSGGQQQRLCIARAVAVQPEVLLLDEPTAALDPISTLRVEETLQALREKYCIVVVTHNLHSLDQIAPRTVVLSRGRKVFDGATEDALATFHAVMQEESKATVSGDHQLQEGHTFVGGAELELQLLDEAGAPAQSFATGAVVATNRQHVAITALMRVARARRQPLRAQERGIRRFKQGGRQAQRMTGLGIGWNGSCPHGHGTTLLLAPFQ